MCWLIFLSGWWYESKIFEIFPNIPIWADAQSICLKHISYFLAQTSKLKKGRKMDKTKTKITFQPFWVRSSYEKLFAWSDMIWHVLWGGETFDGEGSPLSGNYQICGGNTILASLHWRFSCSAMIIQCCSCALPWRGGSTMQSKQCDLQEIAI